MGYEQSPSRRRRHAAYERRQERRWAAKSGPVTVRFVDPAELRKQGGQAAQSHAPSPSEARGHGGGRPSADEPQR